MNGPVKSILRNTAQLMALTMLLLLVATSAQSNTDSLAVPTLVLKKTIREGLSPKSVVHSGSGLFFAQNMMYRHTITVYNRDFELVKTIRDKVNLQDYGFDSYGENEYRGAPVEATFSHGGAYAWVSNYQMFGDSMTSPGCDGCKISRHYDESFVYKINTSNLKIEEVIQVGSVPKYIASTPDDKYILVSNWSSGDLSVIDIAKNEEIKRISLGRYPRGIVVDQQSKYAYVALMGSTRIARVDLSDLSLTWFQGVGSTPRHLCLDKKGEFLYCSLNSSGKIIKIDVTTGEVIESVRSGKHPRSMVLSSNDAYIYAVNYLSDSVSKIDVAKMEVVERVKTKSKPIGITFDERTNCVWVACYSGSLMVFEETSYEPIHPLYLERMASLPNRQNRGAYPSVIQSCFSQNDYENYIGADPAPAAVELIAEEIPEEIPEEVSKKHVPQPVEVAIVKVEPKAEVIASADPVVTEEKHEEVKEVPAPPVKMVDASSYYIIGGSFKSLSNAQSMQSKMKSKGYSAEVVKRKNGTHLVAFGVFSDPAEAERQVKKIRVSDEPAAWIYKR